METLEPHPEAQQAYVDDVDRRMQGTVWTSGGCRSWYLDRTGRNSTLWPRSSWSFSRRAGAFDPGEYLAQVGKQSVVEVAASTDPSTGSGSSRAKSRDEGGDAPAWQAATTEHSGTYSRKEQRSQAPGWRRDAAPAECRRHFHHGLPGNVQ